jgi:hypothetical protein
MEEFASAFQAAQCISTPLVAVRAADPASTTHFTFGWQYVSYGVPEQLREISAQFFHEEREKAVVAMSEACSEIQQVMRASLLELVSHLRAGGTAGFCFVRQLTGTLRVCGSPKKQNEKRSFVT